ncbi:MAG: YceI family protein [Bacteroidota bacterium]
MNALKLFGLLLVTALVGMAFTTPPAVVTYNANTSKSTVNWKGYKVTGSHEGTIGLKNGALTYTDGKLTGGSFNIDMTTMSCTDLEGEWKGKLEGHLKSPDFFDVANHPTALFEITKVASRGTPGDYKITGNLTIKDTTKEIRFQAKINDEGNGKVAAATAKIDRTDFNVRYGSGSFFENLGDKTIYDEFDLTFNLVLEQ